MYTTNETEPSNIKITAANMNANSSTNGHNGSATGGNVVVTINGGRGDVVGSGNTINGNGYKNGIAAAITRRDSAQVLTPLLPALENNANSQSNNDKTTVGMGEDVGVNDNNVENNSQQNNTLYEATASNNNEWKDSVEINNLKNELLHHVNHVNHHHNHPSNQGNNNGSLMNGKNGLGINEKYNEQDPLTGLYNGQNNALRAHESDESDFDSDLQADDDGSNNEHRKSPSCGLFGCRPKWARQLASTHVFMVVFLLAYILQGMYMTYFVSVITTIEKLFQIKSKTTGFLLSASEMGQISTALLLTYFAGRGHRPRWIACGMVVFSLAAFSCSLPHFIFGEQLMHASMISNGVPATAFGHKNILKGLHLNQTQINKDNAFMWPTDTNLCLATNATINSATECNEDRKLEQASQSKITSIVLCIFFVSLLSTGIGQTAVATLGIPYIDDNVASKQSPMYMAITIGVRILGPASGFIVGSLCTRFFVDLSNPGFNPDDPRWIGAWWLGPVMIGSLMMLASIAMFSFPKQLRGKRTANASNTTDNKSDAAIASAAEIDETPKLRDFPKTVRRQLSNDILMFRTASCVFHLLPIAGLYTFLPKYLETQFRLPNYDANMITAFCGILVMGIGIVASGLVILKLKPSARSVAAWIAFTALFYSAGMLILMFVGCNNDDFAGYKPSRGNTAAVIEPACSAALNCTCDRENFAPICGVDGKMYLSSCHAGCSMSELRASDNKTVYANCACIPDSINYTADVAVHEAVSGYCDTDCKNFIIFVLIFASCVFMHSTSEVGSMLLVMRCTHPKDKAMAMGIIQSAIGLFGNVPCPIIYGAVVDSACLIWKTVCGKHGACSLYDAASFRHYFLGMTTGIMFLAFIMDLIVWSKAHRIDIAPEDNAYNAEEHDQTTVTASEYKKSLNENSGNGTPDTSV